MGAIKATEEIVTRKVENVAKSLHNVLHVDVSITEMVAQKVSGQHAKRPSSISGGHNYTYFI